MYSVFLSGPAKAKLLGFLDTGMVPRCLPCGLKTWMPAAVAAYTRSSPSIARPSPPKSKVGRPVRPLGHDFILGEVAPILHSPVGLDVEGQDVLTTFLGKVGN